METWTISSNMKITHTLRNCPCLENFGLGQTLTSSSVWKSCAHHVERHQWLTSSYWMVLLSSTCWNPSVYRHPKKSTAREIRGRGIRRRVAPSNTIPGNWLEFLRLADNKTELFDFLAHQVVENLSGKKDVYTTCGQNVLCSRVRQDISSLAPCTHEEADTRMLLLIQQTKGIAESSWVLWTQMFSSWQCQLLWA